MVPRMPVARWFRLRARCSSLNVTVMALAAGIPALKPTVPPAATTLLLAMADEIFTLVETTCHCPSHHLAAAPLPEEQPNQDYGCSDDGQPLPVLRHQRRRRFRLSRHPSGTIFGSPLFQRFER